MWWQAIVAAIAVCIIVTVIFFRQQDEEHAGFTYDQLHEIYLRKDGQVAAPTLLLLGDSHVHALCEGCLGMPAVNLGIGGDTIGGLHRRVSSYQAVRNPANLAVVEVGANDLLWHSATDLSKSYADLLQALGGVRHVLVYGVFPLAKSSSQASHNDRISQINSALNEICKQMKNCSFVRIAQFYTEAGFLREDLHGGDGIHLNEKAYRLWADDLRQQLHLQHIVLKNL